MPLESVFSFLIGAAITMLFLHLADLKVKKDKEKKSNEIHHNILEKDYDQTTSAEKFYVFILLSLGIVLRLSLIFLPALFLVFLFSHALDVDGVILPFIGLSFAFYTGVLVIWFMGYITRQGRI